jgi:hypothetical protein
LYFEIGTAYDFFEHMSCGDDENARSTAQLACGFWKILPPVLSTPLQSTSRGCRVRGKANGWRARNVCRKSEERPIIKVGSPGRIRFVEEEQRHYYVHGDRDV